MDEMKQPVHGGKADERTTSLGGFYGQISMIRHGDFI